MDSAGAPDPTLTMILHQLLIISLILESRLSHIHQNLLISIYLKISGRSSSNTFANEEGHPQVLYERTQAGY